MNVARTIARALRRAGTEGSINVATRRNVVVTGGRNEPGSTHAASATQYAPITQPTTQQRTTRQPTSEHGDTTAKEV